MVVVGWLGHVLRRAVAWLDWLMKRSAGPTGPSLTEVAGDALLQTPHLPDAKSDMLDRQQRKKAH